MAIKIFYSWQSDLKSSHNKSFIEESIKHAIKESLRADISLEINIDRDTKGEVGSPDIVATIFDKIQDADIFIGDVSIINPQFDGKKTPNPNVLVELGFAASCLGWNRIICVYNTNYGDIIDLPFDLRPRRVLPYDLSDTSENKSKARNILSQAIQFTIKEIDPDKINTQKEILKAYANETAKIKNIAIQKPKYWEFILTSELFKDKLSNVDLKLEELNKNLFFKRTILMNTDEFRDWFDASLSDIKRLNYILSNSITQEMPIAHGKPGEPGDAIKIKKVIEYMMIVCNNIIIWEEELVSIEPPDYLISAKDAMRGTADFTINYVKELSAKFEGMVEDLQTNRSDDVRRYQISLTFDLYEGFTKATDVIIKNIKGMN